MLKKSPFIVTIIIYLFSGIMLSAQQKPNPARLNSAVRSLAQAFLKDSGRQVISIGVYDHGVTHIYHYKGSVKAAIKPDNKSLYEIGSITKTMTGTILSQAVADGKVKLEDDIRKYIDGEYPNLEYAGKPILLYMLLNHSSGLPFDLPVKPDSLKKYTQAQFMADLHQVKLDTVPGIKLHYSNSAAQLLGFIMEKVYHKPFEKLLSQYITRPANMTNTGLYLKPIEAKHFVIGYNGKGEMMPRNTSGAAGGIRSTIPDMLNYIDFSMHEENPVIKLTHEPTWGDIRYYAMVLNWQMTHRDGQQRTIFQSGGTAGFSSSLIFYPELQIGVVLLCNSADHNAQGKLSESGYAILSYLSK
jgi:D-alanyl-D-alanine-carboxypeptidase/D-alanyl-D-alanine-endopeptidase